MRYRIAVLDSHQGMKIADVRKLKAKLDSKYAALYYPWVTVFDSVTRQPLNLPPSGFVAGIYARNDTERAVYKAPANEVVRGAIDFETRINTAQQEVLNPEGINAFRFFEGRGYRLWGARTTSSDPEWKYVNLRRYFAYLGRSIDVGTQWAVFEPNDMKPWEGVKRTLNAFLRGLWRDGALFGATAEQAFFVKCDAENNPRESIDEGKLIVEVGIAPVKPAEFVIFRISQYKDAAA
jgi:phage tail sheath protein FI